MPDPTPSPAETKGPFSSVETRTFKIAGPIEVTITTRYESSHVPPVSEPRESSSSTASAVMNMLKPLAEMILVKLDDIQRGRDADPDPEH